MSKTLQESCKDLDRAWSELGRELLSVVFPNEKLKLENEQLKKEIADYKNKDRIKAAWYGGHSD